MEKKKVFGLLGLGLLVTAINFILGLLFIKFGWKKISTILFPKLIESGQIDPIINLVDSFWIALIFFLIIKALSGKAASINKNNNKTEIKVGSSSMSVDK